MDIDIQLADSTMTNGATTPVPIHDLEALRLENLHTVEPYSDRLPTGYVHDVRMMGHSPMSEHPEMPQRIARILAIMTENNVIQKMTKLPIRPVRQNEVLMVHTPKQWEKVEAIQYMDEGAITDSESYYERISLYVHPLTTLASKLSCGGVIECCLAVARGVVQNSFAIVRPPGHHAEPDEHMGFCFFNNVAVAARAVQQETSVKRILILDWDVHHGNGTQRAFYDDPTVLYVSLHRFEGGDFYPCGPFGGMAMCGTGAGLGTSVNIPWPDRGMGDADYLYAFQKLVMPIAYEFAPELVIISAGFDAAEGDELGECNVTPSGFAHMTHMLMSLAGGKLAVALEGGYNLDSISVSALAVAKVLLGAPPPELPPMVACDVATETVFQCAYIQSRYWNSIDPKACEPKEELAPAQVTIPDLIKAYRSHYLTKDCQMLEIPYVAEDLRHHFASQTFTSWVPGIARHQALNPGSYSDDVLNAETVVLFAHDFGDLRAELQGRLECKVRIENSYLVDASRTLIEWCRARGMGLIDVNIFSQAALDPGQPESSSLTKNALTYLWDNYIEISNAKDVVLIAFGAACQAMMALMHVRSVQRLVRAVVQVAGRHTSVPKASGETMKEWYSAASLVVIPRSHPILDGGELSKRLGNIEISREFSTIRTMISSFPKVQTFVQGKLEAAKAERNRPRLIATSTNA